MEGDLDDTDVFVNPEETAKAIRTLLGESANDWRFIANQRPEKPTLEIEFPHIKEGVYPGCVVLTEYPRYITVQVSPEDLLGHSHLAKVINVDSPDWLAEFVALLKEVHDRRRREQA
jgi:hypothetical protein